MSIKMFPSPLDTGPGPYRGRAGTVSLFQFKLLLWEFSLLDNKLIVYMISTMIWTKSLYLKLEANMFKRSWPSLFVLFSALLFGLTGFTLQGFAQENVFNYNNFSLTLPEGWVKQDISKGSEKEVVGSLKSEKIPGTTILLLCYKGWRYNYSNVRIAGLKTIASVYPKGQEMLKKETKVRTDGGLTAVTELWRGAVAAGGTTVFLQSPMGIMETKAGWILMLGFTPESTGEQLDEDFLKMIKSAK